MRSIRKKITKVRRIIESYLLNITLDKALAKTAKETNATLDDLILRTCIGVDYDLEILPHYLDNLKQHGVSHYRFLLHTKHGKDSPEIREATRLIDDLSLDTKVVVWTEQHWTTQKYKRRLDELISDLAPDRWILTVEADEFPEFPVSLKATFSHMKARGYDILTGKFWDRVAPDGKLHPLQADKPVWEQCPVGRKPSFDGGCMDKVIIHKAGQSLVPGNHYTSPLGDQYKLRPFPRTIKVHHFKWFDNFHYKISGQEDRDIYFKEQCKHHRENISKNFGMS